ncbi:hypothetical protein Bca101_076757 [Brassica carinata]
MGRYSYSQPSSSDPYGDRADSGYSETEELIHRDQAPQYGEVAQYPPQPEVEFGFPQTCYCCGEPRLATSRSSTDPGRRYYTCGHVDDGECHVWKWWDVAAMEEMKARENQLVLLEEKVDNLNLMSDLETEEKVVRLEKLVEEKLVRLEKLVEEKLAKKKSSVIGGVEVVVGVMLIVLVVIGVLIAFK